MIYPFEGYQPNKERLDSNNPPRRKKMSFNVGELVSTLRLDTKEWNKSIEKVKKDIEEVGRLAEKNNLTINLNIGISKE